MTEIGDLNTGRSYIQTYRTLITKPGKQVLLPVLFYIDGANTGQFADLPITAVKISLGIFTRKARDKDHFWGTIGYIPAFSKHKTQGERTFLKNNHMDADINYGHIKDAPGGNQVNKDISHAQDLHYMLDNILEDYIQLQNMGFTWDLYYNKQWHRNVEFVMFTPFFKLDGDEAEKICGKYTSRTSKVKCLCRYCVCPTAESDRPKAKHEPIMVALITGKIDRNATEELQDISQHNIKNATYKIRFGLHNNQGVHGACPMELLHALNLGIFKYVRDCFFHQASAKSGQFADEVNSISKQFGTIMSRQSDRNLPKTSFAKGIRKGKLMAKEYTGVLLCMSAMVRSSHVRDRLGARQAFSEKGMVEDWQLLLDTLLQWEEWLKSSKLDIEHVKAAQHKHRYIMYLIKKVGRRSEGMGLKISKYHGIVHMADDILNFGVPMEMDTGSNERGHKVTKTAAKLTQKNIEFFDKHTNSRLLELHVLELAEQEMLGNALWNYGEDPTDEGAKEKDSDKTELGGDRIMFFFDANENKNKAISTIRGKGKVEVKLEQDLVDYVFNLKEAVKEHFPNLEMRTLYTRQGYIFRADSMYKGRPWRDWVMVADADEGESPVHIMGFVDLSDLPADFQGSFAEYDPITPALYAIVQVAKEWKDAEDYGISDIFKPISKYVGGFAEDVVTKLRLYLCDVETFYAPVAVIQDLGGAPNAYFRVKQREEWAEDFEKWLEEPEEDISDGETSLSEEKTYAESDSSDEEDEGGESPNDSEEE